MPRAAFYGAVVVAQHLREHHALDVIIINDNVSRQRQFRPRLRAEVVLALQDAAQKKRFV
jgi:hypothetical protein